MKMNILGEINQIIKKMIPKLSYIIILKLLFFALNLLIFSQKWNIGMQMPVSISL